MQKASDKYIESMKLPFRNRSYIRGSIGIINSEAQKTAKFSDDTEFTAFSNGNDVFTKRAAKAIYATAEQDFSKVDGSMYFCPTSGAATYMASGVVTKDIKQKKFSLYQSGQSRISPLLESHREIHRPPKKKHFQKCQEKASELEKGYG